jgi:hypothetical protein
MSPPVARKSEFGCIVAASFGVQRFMWKKGLLIAAVSIVVVLIGSAFLFGPKDEALINEALDNSIRASRQGQPGGVAEYMSRNLTVEGETSPGFSINQVVRLMKPDVEVLNRDIVMNGSTAVIESPVNITYGAEGSKSTVKVNRATITFARESGMRWWIIPYPKWRVRDIKTDGLDPSTFMPGLP